MNDLERILLHLPITEDREWVKMTKTHRISIRFIEEHIDRFPWHLPSIVYRRDLTLEFVIRNLPRFRRLANITEASERDEAIVTVMYLWHTTLDWHDTRYPPLIQNLDLETAIRLFASKPYMTSIWLCTKHINELITSGDVIYGPSAVRNPYISLESLKPFLQESWCSELLISGQSIPAEFIIENKTIPWVDLHRHPEAIRLYRRIKLYNNDHIGILRNRKTRLLDVIDDMFPSRSRNMTMEHMLLNVGMTTFVISAVLSRSEEITPDIAQLYKIPAQFIGRSPNLTLDYFLEHQECAKFIV